MLTIHHLNNSRSQRILWLLEELTLPYELKLYHRDAKTSLAPSSLREIHPLGKSPVITDNSETIAESAAIIDYILETYGKGRFKPEPKTAEFLKFNYWFHYAEGSAMPPLLLNLVFTKIKKQPVPFFIRPIVTGLANKVLSDYINPQMRLHIDYMESELQKNIWFAGKQFSAADIQMSFPVEAAASRGYIESKHKKLNEFLARIHARPAYQKALEKGGPFDLVY